MTPIVSSVGKSLIVAEKGHLCMKDCQHMRLAIVMMCTLAIAMLRVLVIALVDELAIIHAQVT